MAKLLSFKASLYIIIFLQIGITDTYKTESKVLRRSIFTRNNLTLVASPGHFTRDQALPKCRITDINDNFDIKRTEENPGPPEDWAAHIGTSVEVICKSSRSFSLAFCGEISWQYQDETCLHYTSFEKKFRRKKRFLGRFVRRVFHVVRVTPVVRVIKCTFSRCSRPRPRDRTPPVIRNCPRDLLGEARPFQLYQFITWAEPTAWDSVDGQVGVSRNGNRPGAPFFEGSTRVGYTARDRSGNIQSCSFYIRITVVRCPTLSPTISDGYRVCHLSYDMVKGTTCQYGCHQGHDLQGGPSYSECLADGSWSIKQEPHCQKKSCEKIPKFPKQEVSCSDKTYFRSICTFSCDDGYDVPNGVRRTKVCLASGDWNGENPKCEDIEKPSFETCPTTMLFYPDDNEDTATVYWDVPSVSDNNDNYVSPVQISGPSIGTKQEVGTYKVSYEAVDTAGNSETCSFNVVVKQLRCSRLYATPYLKMNCTGTRRGSSCSFSCDENSSLNGVHLSYCQKVPDQPYSKWNMDHQPFCEVTETCKELVPPQNGAMACDVWLGGRFCHPLCSESYSVLGTNQLPDLIICDDNGIWLNAEKVTDCIEKATSLRLLARMSVNFFYSGDCQDPSVQVEIKQNFITAIVTSGWQFKCQSKCTIENVKVICGEKSRKKRSSSNLNMIMTVYFESSTTIISSEDYELEVNLLAELVKILRDDDFSADVFSSMNNGTVQLISVLSSSLDTECPDNYIPDYGQTVGCVPCPPGKYYSSENKTCLYCHRGSYQPQYAQSVCLSCPPTQSTAREGATSPQECEDACGPGTYSSSGLPPCIDCDIGLYENNYGSLRCSKCPGNKITIKEGSTDVSKCFEFDLVFPSILNNSYSQYDDPVPPLQLPFTMSMHTKIESKYGQIVGLSSEEFNVTITTTDITVNGETGTFDDCLCMMTKWHVITLHVTENDTTLRLGDATIMSIPMTGPVSVDNLTILIGGDGFAGSISQFLITEESVYGEKSEHFRTCSSERYGDHVVNWNDIAYSKLVNSYIEMHSKCDDFDDCQSEPCIHGNCTDKLGEYSCSCLTGFSGTNCEINDDDCLAHACQNNATCIDGIGQYSCLCEYGYTGDLCEVSMVDGNWADWDNWTDCSVSCGNGTRQRHRSCSDPLPDNGGKYCNGSDTETEECVLDPCRECFALVATNYSTLTCTNTSDMITCTHTCDAGFWFDHDVKEEYKCGNETFNQWDFQTEDNPYARLPQCTEIVEATKIYVAHTAFYDKEICDDSVKELVNETVTREITSISCRQDGECIMESYETLNCDEAKRQRRDLSTDNIGFTVNISCDIAQHGTEECYQLLADAIDEIETAGEYEKLNFLYTTKTYRIVTNTTTSDSVLDCPGGTIPYILYCVPCSIGHYYNTGECRDCQKGTYQDKTGRTYCYTCPEGTTTEGTASLSVDDCVVPVDLEDDKKKWFIIGIALGIPLFLICVVVLFMYCRHNTRGKHIDQVKSIPQRFDNVKKTRINLKRFHIPSLQGNGTESNVTSWVNPSYSLDDLNDSKNEEK